MSRQSSSCINLQVRHSDCGYFSLYCFSSSSFIATIISIWDHTTQKNSMSPPKLAANTPILNILHPVSVGVHKFLMDDFISFSTTAFQCRLCKRFHFTHHCKLNLGSGCIRISFTITNLVCVIFNFTMAPASSSSGIIFFLASKTCPRQLKFVLPPKSAIVIHNINYLEPMFLIQAGNRSYHVGVTFQSACTKIHRYIIVNNNWNAAIN